MPLRLLATYSPFQMRSTDGKYIKCLLESYLG